MTIEKLAGTLVYVQLDSAKPCYVAEKGTEWKASIVINEDDADAWDETYPKQPAKQVKTSDFEEIYKIKPPFPDQRKQYIVTLRKNTKLGNGNPVPEQYHPKVFHKQGDLRVDVTKSVLVSNGSEGLISVETFEGKMGRFARLKNVLVTKLIEYVRQTKGGDGDEFGIPLKQGAEEFNEVQDKKQNKKQPATESSDDDTDIPF